MNGYGACYADVITIEAFKKMSPHAYGMWVELANALDNEGESLHDFARSVDYGDHVTDECFYTCWSALAERFEKDTGLSLHLSEHDSENEGSCPDEVDGYFFHVSGMYKLTPAGTLFKDLVQRCHYVKYG